MTAAAGYRKTAEIDRRDALPYDEFVRDFLVPHRPVLIKNAFPQWKALGKWTPEFFRREHGHRKLLVAGEPTTMGAYIDRVVASTPDNPVPYLRELCVRTFAPELGEDLMPFADYALPNWLRGSYVHGNLDRKLNRASEVEIFIGGAGTILERRRADMGQADGGGLQGAVVKGIVDLHYDPTACPVLLCQIYGKKEWWVFSPDDTPYLYTKGRHSAVPRLDEPDFERYPLLRQATPIHFVQEEGDAVYVPPYWWHATRMPTVSIAASSTFANGAHWDGVIEDVTKDLAGGSETMRAALAAYLKADAVIKELGGRRLGEATHFRESFGRRAFTLARRTVRRALIGPRRD